MKTKKSILVVLRVFLMFVYALFLLWLIPTFFINYNGDWIKKVADRIPLHELGNDGHTQQNEK
ncbi:hypothetical protein JW960_05240 [candidate division KSB1 bacterium]|nr:hypothetical protein [candidate division KSB1 bacterium]